MHQKFAKYKGKYFPSGGVCDKENNLVRIFSGNPEDIKKYGLEQNAAGDSRSALVPFDDVTELYEDHNVVVYKNTRFIEVDEDDKRVQIATKNQANVDSLKMEPVDSIEEGYCGKKWVSRDEVRLYKIRRYKKEDVVWDPGASKDEGRPANAVWSVYQGKAYLTDFSADDCLILHSFDEADVQKGFKRHKRSLEQAIYYKYVLPGEVQKLYHEYQYINRENVRGLLVNQNAGKIQIGFKLYAEFEQIKKDFAAEPKWEDINYGTVWIDVDQVKDKDECQKIYGKKIQSSGWLQKVIPFDDLQKCFEGEYTGIRGFIYAVRDVKHLQTYESIYESLRLDQKKEDGSLAFAEPVFGVIRFTTGDGEELHSSCCKELGGDSFGPEPFTGNGFTAARNGEIIPEWEFDDEVSIEAGAQLYRVEKGKGMERIGRYDGVLRRFMPCQEPRTTKALCETYGMLAGALNGIMLEKWSRIYLYVEIVEGKLAVYFVSRLTGKSNSLRSFVSRVTGKTIWLRSDELRARYKGNRQGYEERMQNITKAIIRAREAYQDANGEGWYRMNYLLDREQGISVEYGHEDVSQIPAQEKILFWMRKYHIG